jgi:GR25 family glycosyltransferase involved in LPS biosynthesis
MVKKNKSLIEMKRRALSNNSDYIGFYINLDRSPQRRAEIETQLERLQLLSEYSRFPAADGNTLNLEKSPLRAGEIGCFISHCRLLEKNLNQTQHLHVMEDHVILARDMKPTLQRLLDAGLLNNFDIVFTDTSFWFDLFQMRGCKRFLDNNAEKDTDGRIISVKKYTVIDLRTIYFSSTSSYFVHKNAISKLHKLLHKEMKHGPRKPIDIFIRDKVHEGEIRAGCIFPFITSIRLDHFFNTTIPGRYECDLSVVALLLIRHSFFTECDWTKCNQLLEDYFPRPVGQDMHQALLSRLFDFVLSERFKSF